MEDKSVPTAVAAIPAIETCCVGNGEKYRIVFTSDGFERAIDDDAVIIFENDFCTLCNDESAVFRNDDVVDDEDGVAIPYTILIA